MKRNITEIIATFNDESKELTHRYYSFDFCYLHFHKERLLPKAQQDIEKSCLVLWSYLASWGMLRGSSFLMQKNPAYLKPLVEWIYAQPEAVWQLDVQDYENTSEEVLELYKKAKEILLGDTDHQPVTLVTKVLLGVFGVIPAYDRFFKDTFSEIAGEACGFSTPNETSLAVIHQFYKDNQEEIDELSQKLNVLDFDGKPSGYHYSKAKIIDMYGFQIGRKKAKESKDVG